MLEVKSGWISQSKLIWTWFKLLNATAKKLFLKFNPERWRWVKGEHLSLFTLEYWVLDGVGFFHQHVQFSRVIHFLCSPQMTSVCLERRGIILMRASLTSRLSGVNLSGGVQSMRSNLLLQDPHLFLEQLLFHAKCTWEKKSYISVCCVAPKTHHDFVSRTDQHSTLIGMIWNITLKTMMVADI